MAGSAQKLKQPHKEGRISQGHFALKSPLAPLHLFRFITKVNVRSLLPPGVNSCLNIIHSNLSYNRTMNKGLTEDVMGAGKGDVAIAFQPSARPEL